LVCLIIIIHGILHTCTLKLTNNILSFYILTRVLYNSTFVITQLCKEFWIEVFRKQIDKLQTNHRGVFVLKDLELRWLTRFPNNQENARVTAIQLLAFPCGMLRGALANLGIPSVVSCDFLTDGQNMASCSFNVKIK